MAQRLPSTTLLLALLLLAVPLGAQPLIEEDLEEPDIYADLVPIFERAEGLFNSPDQPDSVGVIDELLQAFEAKRAIDPPSEEAWDLVTRALFMRVQTNFNLGFNEVAEVDLARILEIEPSFALDRGLVSTKVVDLFENIQRSRIGLLELQLDPPDAVALVGRWQASPEGILQLPSGDHRLTIARPGYASLEQTVSIKPGKSASLKLQLERVAAILTVLAADEDVEIYIDGRPSGNTRFETADQPAVLVVDDLAIGDYELEARKLGFRTYRRQAEIPELADYQTGPIVLERTAAQVILQGFPAGTVVRANDTLVTPDFSGGKTSLTLSPGNYLLAFSNPDRGLYEVQFALADRDVKEIEVLLRPAITLLGVLGSDRQSADELTDTLRNELGQLRNWALIDRTGSAPDIIAAAELNLQTLRTGITEPLPWGQLQREADARLSSSLFLLAVLTDDLLADEAILYIWPSAPLPAKPDVILRHLADSERQDAASNNHLSRLDDVVIELVPALGAVIFDSPAESGAVVFAVDRDRPADRSGLRAGDRIVGIETDTIANAEALARALAERAGRLAASGQTVPIRVDRAGAALDIDLQLEVSPLIRSVRDPELIFAAAGVSLNREIERTDSTLPRWALDLQLAIVHLRGGDLESAIRILRDVKAPEGVGLGSGMVAYTLARALQEAGGSYSAAARQFLEAAATEPTARLSSADGPYILPRAQARLLTLE